MHSQRAWRPAIGDIGGWGWAWGWGVRCGAGCRGVSGGCQRRRACSSHWALPCWGAGDQRRGPSTCRRAHTQRTHHAQHMPQGPHTACAAHTACATEGHSGRVHRSHQLQRHCSSGCPTCPTGQHLKLPPTSGTSSVPRLHQHAGPARPAGTSNGQGPCPSHPFLLTSGTSLVPAFISVQSGPSCCSACRHQSRAGGGPSPRSLNIAGRLPSPGTAWGGSRTRPCSRLARMPAGSSGHACRKQRPCLQEAAAMPAGSSVRPSGAAPA